MITPTPAQLETATPRPRSLLPHEHGAWGQLAMPLLTALAIGRPTVGSLLLTLAVVLAFVAHEPLLVVLGQRGKRAREQDGARALRWLAALGALAAGTGVAGDPRAAGRATRPAPPRRPRRRRRLARPPPPGEDHPRGDRRRGRARVGGVGGRARGRRRPGGRARRAPRLDPGLRRRDPRGAGDPGARPLEGGEDPGRRHALLAALLVAGAAALSWAGLPLALALATLPTAAFSIVICLARFSPKRLRELGWALVGSSAVTLAILVAGLR